MEIGLWFGDPAGVELVVPDCGVDDVFAALSELPDQVLSAGYEWISDAVPDGVTLCNAGDTRSPAVVRGQGGCSVASAGVRGELRLVRR